MRASRLLKISRHAFATLRLAPVLALLPLACSPETSVQPRVGARHLGETVGYAKFGHVSKPIVASEAGRASIRITELPAARIHFWAARESAGPAALSCRVAVGDRPDEGSLTSLELPAGEPVWVPAVTSSDAIAEGLIELACEDDEGASVSWARPIAIPRSNETPAPLVVLVSLDTLRADHVSGFRGAPDISPSLGAIADEGLRVLDATASGAWTLASHYALLFSRIYGFPVDEKPLVSLAQALADHGFITAGLTGGGFMGAAFNYHLGFDHFAEYGTGTDDLSEVVGDALPEIDRFADAPTFLFLHTFAFHELPPFEIAWHAERGAFSVFRPNAEQTREAAAFYASLVTRVDARLASFLDSLRAIADERPVLLVVVSDHGDAFGEHRNFRHGFGDRHVTLHDEVIHVPMIVWGPRMIEPGSTSTRPTMLVDVAPSILAAAGVRAPPSMRGRDAWSHWRGEEATTLPLDFGSVSHTDGAWSLRTREHKLIVEMTRRRGKRGAELYDLTQDPGERHDIARQEPSTVARLRAALRSRLAELGVPLPENEGALPRCTQCAWQDRDDFWKAALDETATPGASAPGDVDADTLQRLRDLGYVE